MLKNNKSSAYSSGYSIGKVLRRMPILSTLLYPFAWLYIFFASKVYRKFRITFPSKNQVAIFIFAEQHQYDFAFGQMCPLQDKSWNIVTINYRSEIMGKWLEKSNWIIIKIIEKYKAGNLTKLPFGIVFSSAGFAKPYYFAEAYRSRRQDNGQEISNLLAKFKEEIENHLETIKE
jgi:hypothetical protein